MTENPLLPTRVAILAQPILGGVGHHLTQPGGPAHPQGQAPAWVTAKGCDLAKLHAAYCSHLVHERRGEDRACATTQARRLRVRRKARVLTLARRTA